MLNREHVTSVYKRYGFEKQDVNEKGVMVFTIRSGHFHNADIVICEDGASGEHTFQDYKASGYAPKIRSYTGTDSVEQALFKGFFSADSTKERLRREYKKFTKSIVSSFSETAKYSYIDSSYTINEKKGESKIVDEICSEMSNSTPILFLIEAAAGFGKTCTAYEFVNQLIKENTDKVPLFSELSRNRQAKIFRYVLLDEIDRSFPSLSSRLVLSEIASGNVPVILDGFDELLHRSKEHDGYENTEPMLETIGELLNGQAKVILTTRRTAIFDGDEFHDWMQDHKGDFNIIRIRIEEPSVREWLPRERYEKLNANKFPIERISNPVLLSYLRAVTEEEFNSTLDNLDSLVDLYFTSMLERERVRQDLRMSVEQQHIILRSIAKDMISYNYTSVSREYIVSLISEYHESLIEKIRSNYGRDERPSSDEISNKLASHALLDRDSDEDKGIGFVNEFVLGNYCAENMISESEWAGDEIFIEPAIISYIPRAQNKREDLYNSLSFCLEFQEASERISYSVSLLDKVELVMERETINNLKLSDISLGLNSSFEDCVFVNSTFSKTKFSLDNFINVTFINSIFYSCEIERSKEHSGLSFLGSEDNNGFIENAGRELDKGEVILESGFLAERYILEKFWPKGRPTFYKHRPIKGITSMNAHFSKDDLDGAIDSLLRRQLIIEPDKKDFAQLNISKLTDIVKILER
jgi:Cdc6-like AAA superfamily ATPase